MLGESARSALACDFEFVQRHGVLVHDVVVPGRKANPCVSEVIVYEPLDACPHLVDHPCERGGLGHGGEELTGLREEAVVN